MMRLPISDWRRDSLRTTLWLLPTILVAAAIGLFVVTLRIDQAASQGTVSLPNWVNSGSPDGARQVLSAIAAAVITVAGLVFSITIVALTLASTQFGPRMLRNFIRDRGTQVALGSFVATFVYTVLVLASVGANARGTFVPHLSVTVSLGLSIIDVGVLIYFVDRIARSIQLPQVVAGIARDLTRAIQLETAERSWGRNAAAANGPSTAELTRRMAQNGAEVVAPASGYLQFIRYRELVSIAQRYDAVIEVLHRPGHFLVQGLPMVRVWPATSADQVGHALKRLHATGPHRTLTQDTSFAIDQLVEIAIRALSPAVNDTFTALTCIDWLADALCLITQGWSDQNVHRDQTGVIRVVQAPVRYERLVSRAYEKIRQSAGGMPAVLIRQLEALAKVMAYTTSAEHRDELLRQGALVGRVGARTVTEPFDLADIDERVATLASTPAGYARGAG